MDTTTTSELPAFDRAFLAHLSFANDWPVEETTVEIDYETAADVVEGGLR